MSASASVTLLSLVLTILATILAALSPLAKYLTNAISVGANNVTFTNTGNKPVTFNAAHKIENSFVGSQIISSIVGNGNGGNDGTNVVEGSSLGVPVFLVDEGVSDGCESVEVEGSSLGKSDGDTVGSSPQSDVGSVDG